MARLPRIDIPGLPQHIIQRGNHRAACFFHDDDYRCYLEALKDTAHKYYCRIHAYVLMTNHVHLLLTGAQASSMSSWRQSLGRCYVRYVNTTYRRTGTLWEGRFKSSIIESDRYLLNCYRYLELNPVRAGLVREPGDYTWGSYAHHALDQPDALIQDHDVYMALGSTVKEQCQAYRAILPKAWVNAIFKGGIIPCISGPVMDRRDDCPTGGSTSASARLECVQDVWWQPGKSTLRSTGGETPCQIM